MLLILISALTVLYVVYISLRNRDKIKEYIRWKILIEKLPTVSGRQFFIGHAGMIFGMSNEDSWKLTRKIHETLPSVGTFWLGPTIASVTLLEADEIEAAISSMQNLEKAYAYKFLHNWLGEGLLLSKGEKWKSRRKMLTPAFHFSILRQFVEIFTRETSKMVQEIEENYLDKAIDITKLISTFTLLTINETSMGTKLDIKSSDGLAYKNAVYRIGDLIYNRLIRPWLHYKPIFDRSAAGKLEKQLVNIMDNFTNNVIRKRSLNFKVFENPKNEDGDIYSTKRKYPLLDILLNNKFKDNSINEDGIREEVNTFMFEGYHQIQVWLGYEPPPEEFGYNNQMFQLVMQESTACACSEVCRCRSMCQNCHGTDCKYSYVIEGDDLDGHDTTAMSLMYTIMLLACNRDIQDEVYQEIVQTFNNDVTREPDYADLQNMTLLERCIKESLRLYPSVAFIGRKLDSDVHTKHGIVPRGSTCFIHIYDLHRNPKYWSVPEKFDPSRHLPENSKGRHPFAYIPFSAGPRNCIGQRFAMLEMKAAICGILRKFILEPVDTPETLILTQDMVLRPKNGVKVKFVPRS